MENQNSNPQEPRSEGRKIGAFKLPPKRKIASRSADIFKKSKSITDPQKASTNPSSISPFAHVVSNLAIVVSILMVICAIVLVSFAVTGDSENVYRIECGCGRMWCDGGWSCANPQKVLDHVRNVENPLKYFYLNLALSQLLAAWAVFSIASMVKLLNEAATRIGIKKVFGTFHSWVWDMEAGVLIIAAFVWAFSKDGSLLVGGTLLLASSLPFCMASIANLAKTLNKHALGEIPDETAAEKEKSSETAAEKEKSDALSVLGVKASESSNGQ